MYVRVQHCVSLRVCVLAKFHGHGYYEVELERSSELFLRFAFLLLHFNDFLLLLLLSRSCCVNFCSFSFTQLTCLLLCLCVCFNFVSLSFHTLWQVFKSTLSCAHTHTYIQTDN